MAPSTDLAPHCLVNKKLPPPPSALFRGGNGPLAAVSLSALSRAERRPVCVVVSLASQRGSHERFQRALENERVNTWADLSRYKKCQYLCCLLDIKAKRKWEETFSIPLGHASFQATFKLQICSFLVSSLQLIYDLITNKWRWRVHTRVH